MSKSTGVLGSLLYAFTVVNISGLIEFQPGLRLPLPMAPGSVRAGFPSPAEDFAVKRHDLNELLITHPTATFFWKARGLSMIGAGIGDGDLLVVNRALTAQHRDIVVAQVDNDFTVKYLHKRAGVVQLRAADPTVAPILFRDGQTVTLCGVVTATIKLHRK
jgi:DNA polymerase V